MKKFIIVSKGHDLLLIQMLVSAGGREMTGTPDKIYSRVQQQLVSRQIPYSEEWHAYHGNINRRALSFLYTLIPCEDNGCIPCIDITNTRA